MLPPDVQVGWVVASRVASRVAAPPGEGATKLFYFFNRLIKIWFIFLMLLLWEPQAHC